MEGHYTSGPTGGSGLVWWRTQICPHGPGGNWPQDTHDQDEIPCPGREPACPLFQIQARGGRGGPELGPCLSAWLNSPPGEDTS